MPTESSPASRFAVSTAIRILSGLSLAALALSASATPSVSAFTPSDGATGVSVSTQFNITFSEAMNGATLTTQAVSGACTGGIQVSPDNFGTCIGLGGMMLSAGNTIANFGPQQLLSHGTRYKFRVSGMVQAMAGEFLGMPYMSSTGFRTTFDASCAAGLTISQIYGGSGELASTYANNFVELHNPSNRTVSLANHTVHYA
ncbi:MAG: Ig-like domain-containing protein, partial [Fuerstia sp.]|nr:Ig-like domain-containing protein [Fuerstiella sp.]